MILRILVAIAVTAFSLLQGFAAAATPSAQGHAYFPIVYLIVPVLLWIGLNPTGLVTWPIASILLLARGHWIIGWIPAGLVAINLIGNRMLSTGEGTGFGGGLKRGRPPGDVNTNFLRYCKQFLEDRCELTRAEADLLVLDPELGPPMDKAKRDWVWQDLSPGDDPDEFLLPLAFDAPEMTRINTLLEAFAREYETREPRVRAYLKSIGHPLG